MNKRTHNQRHGQSRLRGVERLETRNLMAGEVLEIKLDAVALDGSTPITQLNAGQDFLLRGQARDLRDPSQAQGAFQVFTDINYTSAEVTPIVTEVQRLSFTGTPTGGSFKLSYNGVSTGPINYEIFQGNTQALSIQQALQAIPALAGNVVVEVDTSTNSNLPINRYYIRFENTLAGTNVPQLVADTSMLQSDPSDPGAVTIEEYAPGVRSDVTAFRQAFAYNPRTDTINPALSKFPDQRLGTDATNLFDNVGGGSGLFSPPGKGYATYFLLRAKAVTGGADGKIELFNNLPNEPGLDPFLFGLDNALTASDVTFTYGGTATDRLSIPLVSPNHAPTLDTARTPTLTAIYEDNRNSNGTPVWTLVQGQSDVDAGAVRGMAITSAPSTHGTWQFTLNGGSTWQPMGAVSTSAARLLPANSSLSRIRFLPNANFNGNVQIGYFAWDQTQGTAGGTISISGGGKIGGTTAFSQAFETAALNIYAINDPPVVALPTSVGYTLGAPAIAIANTATVKDVDTVYLTGGKLTVQISNGSAADILSIGGVYKVAPNGDVIFNNSVTIGTLQSGSGLNGSPLVVNFNANATLYRVEQLVRSIKFGSAASSPSGTRTISFLVNDGKANSNLATMSVQAM